MLNRPAIVRLFAAICLIMVTACPGWAATYYVKNGGNNSADGLSDATAWETIGKVNGTSFSSGDYVCFKSGDRWDVTQWNWLVADKVGVTYTTYGGDDFAIFNAIFNMVQGYSWVDQGSNIWKMQHDSFGSVYGRVWLDGIEYAQALSAAGVNSTNRWFWESGTTNYIYLYAESNPNTYYTSIQDNRQNQHLLKITNSNNVIENIKFIGAYSGTIRIEACSGNIIRNCEIRKTMGGIRETSNGPAINNTIDNCYISTDTCQNVLKEMLSDLILFSNNSSGNEVKNTTFVDAYHDAINCSLTSGNNFHDNNIIWVNGNYGRAFETSGDPSALSENNTFNRIKVSNQRTRSQINGEDNIFSNIIINGCSGTPLRALSGQGFDFQAFSNGVSKRNKLQNCTIVNCVDAGIYFRRDSSTDGDKDANEIINCNVINCGLNAGSQQNLSLYVENNAVIKNTVYKNNNFYSDYSDNVISYRGTAMDVDTFSTSLSDGDTATVNYQLDPLFFNASANDYRLRFDSPCRWAGTPISGLTTDYAGNYISPNHPDIGAYQYQPSICRHIINHYPSKQRIIREVIQ